MPRPTTRTQIQQEIIKEYGLLEAMLAPLTAEQMISSVAPGSWSIKDVIAHLYAWQQMFFRWYEAGLRGETPAVPAQGFKWSQLPALNQHIYETHRDMELEYVLRMFRASHEQTVALLGSIPEDQLFLRGKYPWMNQNPLSAYLRANTSAHYRWACQEIRKRLK